MVGSNTKPKTIMRSNQVTITVLGLFLFGSLLALSFSWPRQAVHRLAGFQLPSFSMASLAPVPEPGIREPEAAMDVVFVLDTTGSMGGLIEGAKQKIWSIINHLNQYQPQPRLRIGLVAYRDRGDIYITRHTPLDEDLDTIYSDLMGFRAAGGGDIPESVNQALYEAVTRFDWNPDPKALRMIFLVGDAPPHMNYDNDVLYFESCRLARERDIIINTIQCGNASDTRQYWLEIAQLGGGEYAQIRQDGGMVVVAAPQDARIAWLNREIGATAVPYGEAHTRASAQRKIDTVRTMSDYAAAERQVFISRSESPTSAITGREDLVGEISAGRVNFSSIKREHLPEAYAAMDRAELERTISGLADRRQALQKELAELLAARNAFLQEEKTGSTGDAFDDQVQNIIRRQAATKSFTHSTPEV